MEYILGLSGFVIGLITALLYAKKLILDRDQRIDTLIVEHQKLELVAQELRIELGKKNEQIRLNDLHYNEKFALLQQTKEQIEKDFKQITQELYEKRSSDFQKVNASALETLLKPFKEQIISFEKKVQESYISESKERAVLGQELKNLQALNMQMRQDAVNLTNALKGENKTQGNWGELILERILEESGLVKGREYEVQSSHKDQSGKRYQPDVVVHLPDQKDIVVDSKVSLVAYERYMSAENELEKEQALKAHLQSIESHIEGLSHKSYEDLIGVNSLDFVLLFLPIEGAFLLALEHDSRFFAKAFEKNIMVVSPSTLLVTLRTIENIWRYEHQSQHAVLIAQKAGDLYDKFYGFITDMEKVGSAIRKSDEQYQSAMGKLATGRGNIISRVEGLKALGVKAKKELDKLSSAKDAISYNEES